MGLFSLSIPELYVLIVMIVATQDCSECRLFGHHSTQVGQGNSVFFFFFLI